MRRSVILALVIVLLAASSVFARTWHISPDGTGDVPTIQAGIDSAAVADSVLLAPGTYIGPGNKDLVFTGRDITLASEAGPATTIIDCEKDGRGLMLVLGETSATLIRGITVRNGYPQPGGAGGGLFCVSSSPTVSDCVFESCTANAGNPGAGGGAYCQGGSPSFVGCTFRNNSGSGFVTAGGGLSMVECGAATVTGCLFEGNTITPDSDGGGGGLSSWDSGDLTIAGCEFRGNYAEVGGAIFVTSVPHTRIEDCVFTANASGGATLTLQYTDVFLAHSTIQGNGQGIQGAVYFINATGAITHTVIAFNEKRAVECYDSAPPDVTCSDFYGNSEGDWVGCVSGQGSLAGNFSADPLFCDPSMGDLTLRAGSPCAPPGVTVPCPPPCGHRRW